jgi:large subunit ribosomal protein L22
MEVKAISKFQRISPRKVREVAQTLKGTPAQDTLDQLDFIPRKSARLLAKTLKSAISNAENNHNLSAHRLVIKSATVDEGPTIKRFKPAARGSAHAIAKRTSNVTIILTEK